jgi:electron transfer flavoprotein alpha subunit
VKNVDRDRRHRRLTGSPGEQVRQLVTILSEHMEFLGAVTIDQAEEDVLRPVLAPSTRPVAVCLEPDRPAMARELLGAACRLAEATGRRVVALAPPGLPGADLESAWADEIVRFVGSAVEEDIARELVSWCQREQPSVVLGPGSAWGREVLARAAARMRVGLVADAVHIDVHDGEVVAWKSTLGGGQIAAIHVSTECQMITIRPGTFAPRDPRGVSGRLESEISVGAISRVRIHSTSFEDDVQKFRAAKVVVGVGLGAAPEEYSQLSELLRVLGAELGATRKVTDRGWLPHARQIGITGQNIAPEVYFAVGISGSLNHSLGVRGARFVVAINSDPDAAIFGAADVGLVADWREVVPLLAAQLAESDRFAGSRAGEWGTAPLDMIN